jgi:hypothetical protein
VPIGWTFAVTVVIAAMLVGGCGFDVQSPDLFLMTRTGPGSPLTLLVNDGGTIRCNGGHVRPLSDQLLLQARNVATNLDNDAKRKLHFPIAANSVYTYTFKLPDGAVTFPDTAAGSHAELAQAEQFELQAQGECG